MTKVLIIGGGPAGCAAAHQIKSLGPDYKITIIEKSPFIGGGCRTMFMGGHPYTFGPRHFITDKPYLFDFLNRYVPMRHCKEHEFRTYVEDDDQFYTFPISEVDIPRMPDQAEILREMASAKGPDGAKNLAEYWIQSVGFTLYKKFIKNYNEKMWMLKDCSELDTFNWSPKGPSIAKAGEKPFGNKISAYPLAVNGYNDYFPIAVQGCDLRLNCEITRYDLDNKTVYVGEEKITADIVISTLPPDEVMNFRFGELPFIGRDFFPFVLPVEHVFPGDIYFLYYAGAGKVTRCVEYKKLTRFASKNSLLGIEVPSLSNRLYPLTIKAHQALADRYFAEMPEGVYSVGRAGVYRYGIDFDRCIDHGMIIANLLRSGGGGSGSVLAIDSSGEQARDYFKKK